MKAVIHLSCRNTIEAENSSEKQDEQTTGDDSVVENDDIEFKNNDNDVEDATDPDFIPGPRIVPKCKPTAQMRVCLTKMAEAVRKTGISVWIASQVTCALMKDLKIISKEDNSKAIDKCKSFKAKANRDTS